MSFRPPTPNKHCSDGNRSRHKPLIDRRQVPDRRLCYRPGSVDRRQTSADDSDLPPIDFRLAKEIRN